MTIFDRGKPSKHFGRLQPLILNSEDSQTVTLN